jgi:dynein heavy chain
VLQDEVSHEETTANIKFLFIDCGPLKQTLIGHCDLWKQKLMSLLNQIADRELRALHDYFRTNLEGLRHPVTNLDQLAEAVNLNRRLLEEKARTAGRFEPLR